MCYDEKNTRFYGIIFPLALTQKAKMTHGNFIIVFFALGVSDIVFAHTIITAHTRRYDYRLDGQWDTDQGRGCDRRDR